MTYRIKEFQAQGLDGRNMEKSGELHSIYMKSQEISYGRHMKSHTGEISVCKCSECQWREKCAEDFVHYGDKPYDEWMYGYGNNCDDFTPLDPTKQYEEEYFTALQEAAEVYQEQLVEMESDAV